MPPQNLSPLEIPRKTVPNAPAPPTSVQFDGISFNAALGVGSSGHPPDTNGDVGPNYYIQTVNTAIGIYDKSGNQIALTHFNTFMSQGHFGNLCDTDNFGDPVVLYDTFEDRWFITDFAYTMPGRFGGNHRHVNKRRRSDPAEMDVETVRKHKHFAGG